MNFNDQDEIKEIKGLKFKISTEIKASYTPELASYLKERKIPHEIWRVHAFLEDQEEITEDSYHVPIGEDLYRKLTKVSKIANIPVKDMVNSELSSFLSDHVRENPFIFLDQFRDIEKVEDPISIVRKLQPILKIPEDWMKDMEEMDPVKYCKNYGKNIFGAKENAKKRNKS